ncbi:hypothetical protein C5469_18200 [Photorhabdus cinerea]|uniref:Uncharacterized protein n=1 Tax=Photorhabdus cinerea TaxID=471575 RepID=A0A7X5QGL2_9GAMM|nr:hypothetical protein [Photorhabdus cinerea]
MNIRLILLYLIFIPKRFQAAARRQVNAANKAAILKMKGIYTFGDRGLITVNNSIIENKFGINSDINFTDQVMIG